MKKLLATMLALVMALTLCATAWAEGTVDWTTDGSNNASITITTAEQLKAVADDLRGRTTDSFATVTITIDADLLDFTAVTGWTPFSLAGYHGVCTDGSFTIIGKENGTTIKNLGGMLISTVDNAIDLTCKNLTIDGATVSATGSDIGAGAFVGMSGSGGAFLFENCKVKNSTISSEDQAGGFAGYIACDGTNTVTFKNCEVSDCTITGGGDAGGLMGVGMSSDNTTLTVTGTTVKGNDITHIGSSKEKAGSLFGTASGNYSTNSLSVSATVTNNDVGCKENASDTTKDEVPSIYGRGYGATITITGGSYDRYPIKTTPSTDYPDIPLVSEVPAANTPVAEVKTGDSTTYNYGGDFIKEAAKTADTITVTKGSVELTDIPAGVTVVVKETATATVNGVSVPQGHDGLTVYAVTFDSDGGTEVATQNVAAGGTATQPTNPTKNGYVFEHWCLSTDDTHAAYNFGDAVTSNITLKAHWTVQSSGGTHHFNRPQPTTETKAESPKTFDAGIAVYGAMAISSVLGMGYVGKKKF